MWLLRSALRNPVSVVVLVIGVALCSILALIFAIGWRSCRAPRAFDRERRFTTKRRRSIACLFGP